MIMIIVGIFLICQHLVVLNYWIFQDAILEMIADILLVVNSSINSIVYGIFSKQYRRTLVRNFTPGVPLFILNAPPQS